MLTSSGSARMFGMTSMGGVGFTVNVPGGWTVSPTEAGAVPLLSSPSVNPVVLSAM